jgi:outer membrane biosynthesis protein TonB
VPRVVRTARPDRAALLLAIAIAAAIFTISFGFVADADRGTLGAARPQPASPRAAPGPARGERVTLGAAAGLGVRASLLARPVHRTRARRRAPTPSPAASVPSAPSSEVPVQPVDPSAPVAPTPSAPVAPAPSSTAPPPPPAPAPAPVAPKPRPQPAAKPKPPKPPDFDDTGPAVKRPSGSR